MTHLRKMYPNAEWRQIGSYAGLRPASPDSDDYLIKFDLVRVWNLLIVEIPLVFVLLNLKSQIIISTCHGFIINLGKSIKYQDNYFGSLLTPFEVGYISRDKSWVNRKNCLMPKTRPPLRPLGALTHPVYSCIFPHSLAFWKNWRWLIYAYVNQRHYYKNAKQYGKRMRKRDAATRL